MKHVRGFTLIELLVTISLMVLVLGTIVATFAGGSRIWERLRGRSYQEQQVQLAFEEMRRGLHNLRSFEPIPFKGEYDQLFFPALVLTLSEELSTSQEVGQVGYFLDEGRGVLRKSQCSYRLLRHADVREASSSVCTNVDQLRFEYYEFDPLAERYFWSSTWSQSTPPPAVKVEITYHDEFSEDPETQYIVVHLATSSIR